jgi:hypothetical protein
MKDGATQKMEGNQGKREGLTDKAEANNKERGDIQSGRHTKAGESKSSYADKVKEARTSANQSRGGRI